MGVHENISYDKFPKQSDILGKEVRVCFHYDTSKVLRGNIVRDDVEDPGVMIIQLDTGNYVLATECQYSFV